jgi:glucose/arabinose dehydrogenase
VRVLFSLPVALRPKFRNSAAPQFGSLAIIGSVLALSLASGAQQLSFRGSAEDARFLQHHDIQASQLPAPHATQSADEPAEITAPPANARLHVPAGFTISTFAGDIENPRWMAQAPNGDVFVAQSHSGKILILRGGTDGKPAQRFTFAEDLNLPFGMAFHENYLYVGDTDEVLRFAYKPGQTKAEGKPERVIELPGHGYNQHWTRDVIFSPDGSKMYVTVGSQSNDSPNEDPRRAAVNEYNPDGSGHKIFASGLRNPVGIAFYPGTQTLWASVNERDDLGDDLPPDYATSVQPGGFYGWPYAYIGRHPDPRNGKLRPDLVQKTLVPDVLIEPHGAALGLAFYQGPMFPAQYRGDAFVALHGSWNRSRLSGYKVIRIHFKDGRPAGGYDDFVTGWAPSPDNHSAWGRPVGVLVLKDGSLLISDDGADKIWRVTYR